MNPGLTIFLISVIFSVTPRVGLPKERRLVRPRFISVVGGYYPFNVEV